MSSDMFSSLVEKGSIETELTSYREIEFRKWEEFSDVCKLRRFTKCNNNDASCFIDNCSQWQLFKFIRYGVIS